MSLLEMAKRDVSGMTDEELDSLVDRTAQSNGLRTRNVGTRAGASKGGSMLDAMGGRSKWIIAASIVLIIILIMFMTDEKELSTNTNGVERHKEKGSSNYGNNNNKKPTKPKKPILDDENEEVKEEDRLVDDKKDDIEETTTTTETTDDTDASSSSSSTTVSTTVGEYDKEKEYEDAYKVGRRPRIPYKYNRRSSRQKDEKLQEEWKNKYGSWTFVDPTPEKRPKDDYCGQYPNRDIKWDQFPNGAWQIDSNYLSQWLPQAKGLVERAIEAILTEYGYGKETFPDIELDERCNMGVFQTEWLDLNVTTAGQGKQYKGNTLGGWITQQYFDGLIRRAMHAIITQDTFTVVMGGHSAAAGHGNHFIQSYTAQIQKAMEPVFARLGVRHKSHNM